MTPMITQLKALLTQGNVLQAAITFTIIPLIFLLVKAVNRLRNPPAGTERSYFARQRAAFANRHSRRPARWAQLRRQL